MAETTLNDLEKRVKFLEKVVVEMGERIDKLTLHDKLMSAYIDSHIEETQESKMPDHENIRGPEYYK